MFGFLRPSCQTTAYRQAYARCCQYQRHNYGLLSLPFLSYEAVLLYLIGIDSGEFPAPEADAPTCCRLRSKTGLGRITEAPLGEFAASLGLLLASIKLEDDRRDGSGWLRVAASWILSRRLLSAASYFETLDADFRVTVREYINEHLELEQTNHPIKIGDYSTPTGNAFGYTFGLLSKLDSMSQHRAALLAVGEQVGRAIIAFDCAVDWERDRKRGEFNPLPDTAAVAESLRYCSARLRTAAQICRFNFGHYTRSESVLMSVNGRIESRLETTHSLCQNTSPRRQLASPGSVYTFMDLGLLGVIDGCCEVVACCEVGSCCEVGAAGGEAGCALVECCSVGHCPCPCDPVCGDPFCWLCDPQRRKKSGKVDNKAHNATADARDITFELEVGMWGVARSPLRPAGQAVFDGRYVEVTTDGDYVEAGTQVEIVDISATRTIVHAVES